MRTCFVHIGMHKTGSTAIQTAFYGYNDGKTAMLRLDKPNHTFPLAMIFSAKREWAAKRYGVRTTNLDKDILALRARIARQFQASKSNFVISGEGLSTTLTATEIATFKTFLSAWFDDIKIIVYLRDPTSYLRSMFQQKAKTTAVVLDLSSYRPLYQSCIAGWLQVFGRDKIDAVLFDRSEFAGGSVLDDFASRVGFEATRSRKPSGNISLRAEGFALTYATRNAVASGTLTLSQLVKRRADLYMTREYGQLSFDFSNVLYESVLADQIADIAWAEQLLRRPFPPRQVNDNAVVFGSHDDVLRYAAECRTGFEDWKRRHFGRLRRVSYLVRALRRSVI